MAKVEDKDLGDEDPGPSQLTSVCTLFSLMDPFLNLKKSIIYLIVHIIFAQKEIIHGYMLF